MAEIPIKEKSDKKWLWIILAVVALILLAWWLLDNDDGDVVEYTDNDTVATEPMAGTAMTAMAIGDTVNLDQVRVTELTGDMAFHVDANGQDMLVLFDQTRTPDTAKEGEFDINVGSLVNLDGTVMSASEALPAGVMAEIPAGTESYIYATDIEMVS
ncbi:hypothetical protein [Croceicoccus marinus]|jgi:hypothetical protein|uniref:Uncharacterized protein n=1 Tax=Croceicoccus marinus TaxID=450378 RepID=A0A7G6VW38_9SPHN|nr:hypothetical protein [Croceicoccus marinus]QNE05953.1 hypothetical protein H4O24_04670 [Croceicoccus marinus]